MSYNVETTRQPLNAVYDLKGPAEALRDWAGSGLPAFPEAPNTRTTKDGIDLYYIGRDHWLVRGALSAEDTLDKQLKPTDCPADISIVQVSDTLTFFRVTGADADQVMATACPLDLHETVFAQDAVTYSEVFGLKALVMRCDGGFEFAIEQSFADMTDDYLARAKA